MRKRTAFQLSGADAEFLASMGVTATTSESETAPVPPFRKSGDSLEALAKLQGYMLNARRIRADKFIVTHSGEYRVVRIDKDTLAAVRQLAPTGCGDDEGWQWQDDEGEWDDDDWKSPGIIIVLDTSRVPHSGDVVLLADGRQPVGLCFAYIVRVEDCGALQVRFGPGAPQFRIDAGSLKRGWTRIEGVVDDPSSFRWE